MAWAWTNGRPRIELIFPDKRGDFVIALEFLETIFFPVRVEEPQPGPPARTDPRERSGVDLSPPAEIGQCLDDRLPSFKADDEFRVERFMSQAFFARVFQYR